MSLALARVPVTDFQVLYRHVGNHSQHQNMHYRWTTSAGGVTALKYLSATRVVPSAPVPTLQGMICGPGLAWVWDLKLLGTMTQLTVHWEQASAKEKARMATRFLTELLARVHEEQNRPVGDNFSNYSPGQFYLRRSDPGMPATHRNCAAALAAGALPQFFLDALEPWKFCLVHP